MLRGKHVYVQKPLKHTISEARLLTQTAEKYNIVTQTGNQGGSKQGVVRLKQWVQDQEIESIEKGQEPLLFDTSVQGNLDLNYN
jgi:predicted dehydrogenase